MRLVTTICLITGSALFAGPVDIKDCPDLREFRPEPYLKIATALQSMPKEQAIAKLRNWSIQKGYSEQIVILCRMLFEAQTDGPFRRPGLGGAEFFGGTTYADWPLEPITLIDGIPFTIVLGYFLAGQAESGSQYLEYCVTTAQWTSRRYHIATSEQIEEAFHRLLTSKLWKKPLSDGAVSLLKKQING